MGSNGKTKENAELDGTKDCEHMLGVFCPESMSVGMGYVTTEAVGALWFRDLERFAFCPKCGMSTNGMKVTSWYRFLKRRGIRVSRKTPSGTGPEKTK